MDDDTDTYEIENVVHVHFVHAMQDGIKTKTMLMNIGSHYTEAVV